MDKGRQYYIVDAILFVLIFTSLITSFSRSLRGIHQLAGYLLVIMVTIHLILHWRWIVTMTKNIFTKQH